MAMNKISIPAIHDNDLLNLLGELKLIEPLNEGDLNCHNCDEVITLDNLAGLKVINKSVVPICSNPECIAEESLNVETNG